MKKIYVRFESSERKPLLVGPYDFLQIDKGTLSGVITRELDGRNDIIASVVATLTVRNNWVAAQDNGYWERIVIEVLKEDE